MIACLIEWHLQGHKLRSLWPGLQEVRTVSSLVSLHFFLKSEIAQPAHTKLPTRTHCNHKPHSLLTSSLMFVIGHLTILNCTSKVLFCKRLKIAQTVVLLGWNRAKPYFPVYYLLICTQHWRKARAQCALNRLDSRLISLRRRAIIWAAKSDKVHATDKAGMLNLLLISPSSLYTTHV